MQTPKPSRRFVVIGDVHGQYEPFISLLRHAGLIDASLNWIGGHDRMLQIGDIFDRGPQSKESDALLDKIQLQAAQAGGEVIRLVGNHELEILLSNFSISGLQGTEAIRLREKFTAQVLNGQLRAAYAYKGFLFTHAGVTGRLYKIFQMQLDDASPHNIAVLINLIFKESIKHQFFKHPIFNISISRSGTDKFGGIFWEDLEDLLSSCPRSELRQVVGHTPVDRIILDNGHNVIAIDVGLYKRLEYLQILNGVAETVLIS